MLPVVSLFHKTFSAFEVSTGDMAKITRKSHKGGKLENCRTKQNAERSRDNEGHLKRTNWIKAANKQHLTVAVSELPLTKEDDQKKNGCCGMHLGPS